MAATSAERGTNRSAMSWRFADNQKSLIDNSKQVTEGLEVPGLREPQPPLCVHTISNLLLGVNCLNTIWRI